jgi:predicted DNA-binding protein
MAISFRLDPETEAKIRRLVKQTGRSKSALVREAMAQYVAAADSAVRSVDRTALDRLRPFVGIVATETQGSTDTHRKYRAALERKHRGRRSR